MKPLKEQEQLPLLAELAAKALGAAQATIEVRDEHFGATYSCGWPLPVEGPAPGAVGRPLSPWPQRYSSTWIEEGSNVDGMVTQPLAVLRVPMEGAQAKRIGAVQCYEKRLASADGQLVLFDPYDIVKLKTIAEMATWIVERATRQKQHRDARCAQCP